MRVKEESEKAGLKLNIQKTKIMAYSPIISRQIDGETMETVTDFIFLGSKITADCDCSHEIMVKKPPAIQETLVEFLGLEDPLEKGEAAHSSVLGLALWLSW